MININNTMWELKSKEINKAFDLYLNRICKQSRRIMLIRKTRGWMGGYFVTNTKKYQRYVTTNKDMQVNMHGLD